MAEEHDHHGSSRHMSASQKELGDEDARVVRVGDAERTNERLEFAGNAVRTAKYSPLTFLPRNLFEQFHRLAYVYFLVIAVLNQLPQLAVFGRGASVMPLAFVLTVTAVKDAYEDWRRHRSDRAENGRLAATLNLDGESNLKTRYAKQETLTTPPEQLTGAVIRCERPNRNIYGFQANLELEGESRRIPLGPSNIVLRGCELKNTTWAIGVVVYAGRETKAMLNNAGAPTKRSRLETQMNRETLFLSAILVVLCSLVAALSGVWLRTHKAELELAQFFHKKDYHPSDDKNSNYNYYGIAAQIVFVFLMAVIVFQIMIPISLYISMELVRLGQAYFMIRDTTLYDASSNSRFQCRALNINEDLGQVKCVFSDKTGTLTQNKMEFRFDVLGLHEFDSDRKRMSVIIGCPDKTVKLFVKGADNSMFGVIDKTMNPDVVRATEKHLHAYSSLGLRTLVIGVRELSQEEFQEWQMAYEKASTALLGRGGLLRGVAANIEQNLRLLGASGIEDKLQDGVPEAIEKLREAGIKVWVLTGDKQETAISIGFSCKLLTREMTQIVINSNSRESCRKSLDDAISMVNKLRSLSTDSQARVPLALIIDGNSLVYIFDTEREEKLFEVAIACDVVLCCRVAPLQKAGIVDLIKKRTSDMTLAIGDGANDVSMIQMADVGIGISGQEGRQAVMASDFAMGQFRFLVDLLLVHGHWNYQRMGYMILYNFYRNATFVFVLFWYVLHTGFTLTTAITEWSSVLYSVIYTAVPTIVVAILDKDLSRRTLLKYPQLYGAGQREESYNLRLFIFVMLDSIWQSLAVFFIPYLAYRKSTIDGASLGDLWTLAVVILVNIHLAMDVIRWNWITHAAIWGSIVATLICVMVIDSIPILPGFWAIYKVMGTGLFWALLLAVIVVGMIPHFVAKAIREHFLPNDIQIAREMEKSQDSHDVTHPEIQMSTVARA
uniref:Phospholipid-transporting ATPase n=1 Tax=Oryza meridionalis TaxID=40149 RepID=A0A0E0CZW1_9ORYZ